MAYLSHCPRRASHVFMIWHALFIHTLVSFNLGYILVLLFYLHMIVNTVLLFLYCSNKYNISILISLFGKLTFAIRTSYHYYNNNGSNPDVFTFYFRATLGVKEVLQSSKFSTSNFWWFFILHHSQSLEMCVCVCVCVCLCVCVSVSLSVWPSPNVEPKPIDRSRSNSIYRVLM